MENFNRTKHWETIYQTKKLEEVSWFQATPTTSLDFLNEHKLPLHAKIIDIGGGDSFFVDHLLEIGYTDVTVLDISASALDRAKQRLGAKADLVQWIVADAATFQSTRKYDFWHDRAAFHFLTLEDEITGYLGIVEQNTDTGALLVLATFSEQGPRKCSGIEIKQYSETSMNTRFKGNFNKLRCVTVNHLTPNNTSQNFVFCSFRKH
jgi:SAM-dependent methyltransferase